MKTKRNPVSAGMIWRRLLYLGSLKKNSPYWPAPGSKDTELRCLMELEVGHGETEVYTGVQA